MPKTNKWIKKKYLHRAHCSEILAYIHLSIDWFFHLHQTRRSIEHNEELQPQNNRNYNITSNAKNLIHRWCHIFVLICERTSGLFKCRLYGLWYTACRAASKLPIQRNWYWWHCGMRVYQTLSTTEWFIGRVKHVYEYSRLVTGQSTTMLQMYVWTEPHIFKFVFLLKCIRKTKPNYLSGATLETRTTNCSFCSTSEDTNC